MVTYHGKGGSLMKLIILEGIDGSGKTTLATKLAEQLKRKGYDTLQVVEPWQDPIGSLLREVLQSDEKLSPLGELALFLGSRAELMSFLNSYRNTEKVIISDRSFISNLIYQGLYRGLGWEKVRAINRYFIPDWYNPDLVIVTHAPLEVIKKRLEERKKTYFERISPKLFKKLYQAYQNLPLLLPNLNIKLINTDRPADETLNEAMEVIETILKRRDKS